MKVENLNEIIKFMAICNQIEQGNLPNEDVMIDDGKEYGNFDWNKTKQHESFWWKVSEGEPVLVYEEHQIIND